MEEPRVIGLWVSESSAPGEDELHLSCSWKYVLKVFLKSISSDGETKTPLGRWFLLCITLLFEITNYSLSITRREWATMQHCLANLEAAGAGPKPIALWLLS